MNKVNPNAELMLSNMEEVYDTYMKSERTLCQLLSIVSFICIAIAVFGIFSLVTLSCQQRRKEIAIRKVNGANIGIILNLFFREYLLLLVFSSFFAFPLGYVMARKLYKANTDRMVALCSHIHRNGICHFPKHHLACMESRPAKSGGST